MSALRAIAALLCLVCACAFAADPVHPPPQPVTLPAPLEAARAELLDIVARRDADALLAHVRDDTIWSFGGDMGVQGFKHMWRDRPEALSRFWRELDAALVLEGVAIEDGELEYCAPYVFCLPYPGDIDPFEAMIVLGKDVAIRNRPGLHGKVVARVSHAVLTGLDMDDPAPDPRWLRVRLASGLEGHVSRRWVRSPIDYRLIIIVQSPSWWLRFFVTGD